SLGIAAKEGEAFRTGAAERADQRAGEHRAEIDGEHAESEQEPVEDLRRVLRDVVPDLLHARPTMPHRRAKSIRGATARRWARSSRSREGGTRAGRLVLPRP